jgi:hypothetical protein
VDHLYAAPVFVNHYRQKSLRELVVVASDVGGAKMARGFAKRLNATLAIIDKRRPSANVAEVVNVVGEVKGKDCIIPDDMIDRAHDDGGGPRPEALRARSTSVPRTRCCRARRWSGSSRPRWRKWR